MGEGAAERRVDGEPVLAGVRWTAAAFWGLGMGKRQKNEGNGLLGYF